MQTDFLKSSGLDSSICSFDDIGNALDQFRDKFRSKFCDRFYFEQFLEEKWEDHQVKLMTNQFTKDSAMNFTYGILMRFFCQL